MFQNASIGDFVWDDLDADGIQDVGETGINNVSVELFNTADVSQGTTTTNTAGAYSFTGLTPADYYVVFTIPAGYILSPQDQGADDTADSDANTATGRTANYTLTSGETETSADAGVFQNASIGDFVWDDLDADGIQDVGEVGINNVSVELFNTADVSQGTTTTNAAGAYSFSGLTPSDYYLVFTTPAGFSFSPQDAGGDDALDSDANTTTGRTANYTLTSGESETSADAGMNQAGSIGDFVWDDLDADGIQDVGETGLNNVTVELLSGAGALLNTTTTNAAGAYSFTSLAPANYRIRFTTLAGYSFSPRDVGADDNVDSDPNTGTGETGLYTVTSGLNITNVDAGMFTTATISDFVWDDLDADGIQDVGETGINNVSIELFNAADVSQGTTTTNAAGAYSFTGLNPGDYYLVFTTPAGYNFSPLDAGADDTVDSDANTTTGRTADYTLTSGETETSADAGMFQNASIGDFVWDDLDADGIQDVGEIGINNVSVELFNTADVSQGTTTTNAAGAYSFTGLTPADYYVVFTTPAGYNFSPQDQGADDTVDSDANTTTGRTANYTLTSGESETSADAGMFQNASIGDFVWEDLDADGIQDVGETGINNVSVELFNTADVSQGTTTTNAAGAYSFTGLTPADYYVVFTTPAGYNFSPLDVGADDTIDSDANTTTGRTANYTLTSGESETSADAGMYQNASIGDFVWDDLDADGIQDVGETGINNVTVELFNTADVSQGTTTTNAAGAYSFTGLTPADYYIVFTSPAGYNFSPQNVGADDTIDSDANSATGRTANYTLTSGESETSADAGMFQNASIGDFVWDDLDADGIQDVGETGINNVSVELFNTADVSQGTTTTNAAGAYSFTGLTPADYYVVFTTPAGYNFSPQDQGADDTVDSDANTTTGRTANYTLTSGETETSADAGMFQNASIGDFVWDDLDADGIQDVGETGINNVSVELFNTADVSQGTTTTNAAGAYSFTGLTPADYYVVFTTPAGYNFSPQDQGADDTVDSDANTTTGRTANYTLTSGEAETSADAGMFLNASIGDFVWDDLDADGIQDGGEVGINNVSVELFNAADVSQGTTTTNAAGAYSFTGLTPADYYVVFTTPVGYNFSPQDQGADDTVDSDANTATGRTANYTLTSGESETSADAGMFQNASIGDFVWDDLDADGIQDVGEVGINNVSVELFNTADVSQGTTTTNAAGAYSFTGLTPGDYYLVFTTPAGFSFSPLDAGGDDALDSDANTTTGRTANYTLTSGESETSADAAMNQAGSIGDFVWDDLDADGIQDVGETGLNNVTVELLSAVGVVLNTTTTNAAGAYSFTSLSPANYRIRFTTPAGYSFSPRDVGADDNIDSDPDTGTGETGLYTVTSGLNITNVDAGMFTTATISDFVWEDLDADGIQDVGETGINNVSIELFNAADVSQGTTTTNAAGAYSFSGLNPGDYYLVFTTPAGYNFSPLDAGVDDTVDSDANTATGRTVNYTLTSGETETTADAGMFRFATISDFVWEDLDADGIQDAGEIGVNNVTVELFNTADVSQGTTTTNATGAYSFTGITPADYYLVFTTPATYNFSPQDQGADDTVDSDANTTTGRTANYTLTSNEVETSADAGMYRNATISDFVWEDLDADGIQDVGETGINNVTVELFDTADVSQGTTTTNAVGAYNFTGLTPADYYLVFTTPGTYNFSPLDVGGDDTVDSDANTTTGRTANYTLSSNEVETSADAGMFRNATISDFVWDDLDADGIQDGGETGVNNVAVELFNASAVSQGTTTTNAAGAYSFTGLTPGTYFVEFTTPAGFSFSPQDQGADDTIDSDANTTTGRTGNYVLISNQVQTTADAGMFQNANIGDFVWEDLDADGIQDAGEIGINNVSVELFNAADVSQGTTTTNAAGAYSFTGLTPADYYVVFTTPAGYNFSPQDQGADDALDSDANTTTGRTANYTLTSGETEATADAGMFRFATISDFVWEDLDADGIQDVGETGINAVSIELFNAADVSQGTTTTNAAGAYSFTGLTPATYYVVFTAPATYNFSPQDQGADDTVDSDANTATGRTANYVLTSNETETSADAGMFRNATISDFVWEDLDADGIQDAGETGVNNVSVELFNGAAVSQGTTTTNAAGAYSFTGLTPGTYFVEFTTPATYNFSPQDQGADDTVDSDASTATGRTANYVLISNEVETSADAGMFRNATISDFVWDDLDADGIQDVGEIGINLVSVELFNTADVSQGTTTTNAAGAYSFTGLTPGDYYLVFTTPAGYIFSPLNVGADDTLDSDANTATGRTANYTLISNQVETSADVGMYLNATFGDFVWDDLNANGLQDLGETGINNVAVELFNGGGVSQGTTTTNAAGAYSFTGLTPGQYRATFTLPAGYSFSPQDVGADDTIDSDANSTTGQTALYTLVSGQNQNTVDAAMFLPAVIGDFVWDDLDADGVQDVGETGINNVTVELFDTADVSQGTTTTNAAGAYSFSGLTPDDYYVVFTLPAGYLFSPQDAGGDDNLDSDANTTTGRTANYTIASGDTETSVDAAMYLNATISDFVWDDLDADGIQDAGEPGLNGVTVELFNGAAVSQGTTTTAAGGAYSFTGLTPGDYFVGFTLPAGYQFSALDQGADDALDSDANTISGQTTTYTLTSGETETSVDAGMFTTGSIGDFVFEDIDGDGLQDAGEPGIDGVTVDLLDFGGAVINTTTTAGGGAYNFAGLVPAQYRIRFTTPLGYSLTTQFVGLDDTIDSDASQITGETALVTIASGESNTRLDAGMYLPATIGDSVWIDYNGDGLQGEAGLAGVTVELLDSAGTVLNTTTTSATGAYSFAGLTPQQYRIRFVPPGAYRLTTANAGSNDAQDSDADPVSGETGTIYIIFR